jgi:hypothetical protein
LAESLPVLVRGDERLDHLGLEATGTFRFYIIVETLP